MLSVVLATHNEEANLARCLQAIKTIADEIVIVDGESTDNTVDIAKKFNARIITTTNKANFHINKQMGIDAAKGEWILQLDADEVVSPTLGKEITQVISLSNQEILDRNIDEEKSKLFARHQALVWSRNKNFSKSGNEIVAFFVPRLNMFLGKPLLHGGVYPDAAIRLIKNHKARLPCKDVHELYEVDGQVAWLEHDLLHYDSPTFSRYISRANRYTSFTALQFQKQHLPHTLWNTVWYLFIKPIWTFLSIYFRHKGFLDGFPGFIWALFSALHYPIAYMKYWEMAKVEKRTGTKNRG